MDIELLSKMVGELILDNDSVSLPGVGTFVAEDVPASFSDRGYTINPPYRRLSFHSASTDDDLLAALYSSVNGVEQEAAKSIITAYLSDLKAVLKDRKTVVMPGLGRLRATRENNFFFVADEDLDIFPDGCGLEPVSLKSHDVHFEDISSLAAVLQSPIPETEAAPETSAVTEMPVSPEVPAAETPAEPVAENAEAAEIPVEVPSEASAEAPQIQEETPAAPEEVPAPVVRKRSHWWIAPLVLVTTAAVMLAVFLILARVAPDFIDSILYTPEELRILNY